MELGADPTLVSMATASVDRISWGGAPFVTLPPMLWSDRNKKWVPGLGPVAARRGRSEDDHSRGRCSPPFRFRSPRPAAPRGHRQHGRHDNRMIRFPAVWPDGRNSLPKFYFPSSDPLTGMLQAFAVFAVGFVARPIGAAIFGHYGDRIGRRATVRAAKSSPARHSAVFRSPCSAIDRSFKPSSADLDTNPVAVASSNSPCQLADRQCRGRRPQAYSRNPEAR